jgi:hypothetical protein
MIRALREKVDEILLSIGEYFRSVANKITPNWILFVTLINGFFLGLITTGFMGDKSVSVHSLTFFFFMEQFAIICFFSSSHVNFTTAYLNKFVWAGVLGYAIQWQIFGAIARKYGLESSEYITPPFDGTFAIAFFTAACIFILFWCFSKNKARLEPAKKYTLWNGL